MSKESLNNENSYDSIIVYPTNISLDKLKMFEFNSNIKFLRIDVGLSHNAPVSVDWLFDTDDRGIIGIEPHPNSVNAILNGTGKNNHLINLNDNFIVRNNSRKTIQNNQYFLINCAIDNVTEVKTQKFYSTYPDNGNSGLVPFQNSKISGNEIEYYINVPTIPLKEILNKIDWERFEFIEVIKTDAELKDLDVLKSCCDFLKKVVYLRVEAFKGYYPNTVTEENPEGWYDTATQVTEFLDTLGFRLIDETEGDYKYVNTKLEDLIVKHNLTL